MNRKVEVETSEFKIQLALSDRSTSMSSLLDIKVLTGEEELTHVSVEVHGTALLYTASNAKEGATVIAEGDSLYISCGDTIYSFQLPTLKLNWTYCPDQFEMYEMYKLENDLLIRGELAIHRIDKNGNSIWRFGGRDIFVSMEGEEEVKVFDDYIILTDFNGDKYKIDYNGKTIE